MKSLLAKIKVYQTVLHNTLYLSILEAVHLLLPFVALPYIIKTVGAENYGKVVFAQTIALYFMTFVNFGLDTLAVRYVARNRKNKTRLELIVGSVLTLKGITFCIGLLCFSLIVIFWEKARCDWPLFFAAYLICLTDVFFTPWFFQGIEKMFIITIVRGSSMLLYILLLLLCLRNRDQYWLVPLLQSSALLITAVYGFYHMCCKEKSPPKIPSIHFMKKMFKESFSFFLSRSSVQINNSIAPLVIGIVLGKYEVAVYDIAQKIARAALIPVYMLTQAIYPNNARNRDKNFAMRAFVGLFGISLVGLTVLFFIAPYLVKFLGNDQLNSAVPLLRYFEIYILVGVCSIYSGTPLLVAWGYSKAFANSVLISTAVLLVIYGVLLLLNIQSMYYFATALLISELVILGYRLFYCIKYKILTFS